VMFSGYAIESRLVERHRQRSNQGFVDLLPLIYPSCKRPAVRPRYPPPSSKPPVWWVLEEWLKLGNCPASAFVPIVIPKPQTLGTRDARHTQLSDLRHIKQCAPIDNSIHIRKIVAYPWREIMSIARRLYLILGIMVLLISAELSALWFTIHTLSAVRAYVGGEGLWSKAEKDAAYHLEAYGRTRDQREYQAYLTFLSVSLGDREARLEFSKSHPNPNREYQGFLRGRNNANDIPGMISLFRRFSRVSFISEAIVDWTAGDVLMIQFQGLGARLHAQVQAGKPQVAIDRTLNQIAIVNQRLTVLEDHFSYTLGAGSRWLTDLVLKVLFGAALTVELSGLILTASVTRGISRRLDQVLLAAARVSRGEYTTTVEFHSSDEIGRLAVSFNNMTRDIERERRRAANAFLVSETSLKEAQRVAHIGSWDWDFQTGTLSWSKEMCRIHEMAPEEFESSYEAFMRVVHPDDTPRVDQAVCSSRWSGKPFSVDYRLAAANGGVRWLCADALVESDDTGKPIRMVGSTRDITERKLAEEKLEYLAAHDPLTGLLNRPTLVDHAAQLIAAAQRGSCIGALLFVDVDHFKRVNDTFGHATGDHVLAELARRLKGSLRASDIVARSGGDEFLIAITGLSAVDAAAITARSIAETVARPFLIGSHELCVSASIGISVFPNDSTDIEALIRYADAAMYQAKSCGRDTFQFYTAQIHEHAIRHLALDNDLRRALERQEFSLCWQPIVDLGSGELIAAEALLRWRLASGAVRLPGDFLPVAENNGLIVPIGDWVMRAACAQARAWQALGLKDIRATVNVSARQLSQPEFLASVENVLGSTGLDPRSLEIEITETAVMADPDSAQRLLHSLRALGVRVSLDDFGTGYSSLSYLKRLPIDGIKIDSSFVRGIANNDFDVAIIRAIIALCRSVGIKSTAEGVESLPQLERLIELGCDLVQGYFFSEPVDAQSVPALLRNWASFRTRQKTLFEAGRPDAAR
jgi:diguanylate cyclase (GGDEF)-like protein/PAS domain S-box-containing protein